LLDGRTTLLVAHRRSTLRLADRIVVVDKGRVVDSGSHAELMADSPLYRTLLAGPDDDCEGDGAGPDDVAGNGARDGGVTLAAWRPVEGEAGAGRDRKSTRLNSSHVAISY